MEKMIRAEITGSPTVLKTTTHRATDGRKITLSTGHVPVTTIDDEKMIGAFIRIESVAFVPREGTNIIDIVKNAEDDIILPVFDNVEDAARLSEISASVYVNTGFAAV